MTGAASIKIIFILYRLRTTSTISRSSHRCISETFSICIHKSRYRASIHYSPLIIYFISFHLPHPSCCLQDPIQTAQEGHEDLPSSLFPPFSIFSSQLRRHSTMSSAASTTLSVLSAATSIPSPSPTSSETTIPLAHVPPSYPQPFLLPSSHVT